MKPHIVSRWILFGDLLWSIPALLGAEALRYGGLRDPALRAATPAFLPFLALTAVLWMLLSSWMKLDCFRGGWRFPAVVSQVLLAVLCLMSILLSAGYLRRDYVSRLALSYFGILLFLGFVGIRYSVRFLLLAKHRTGRVRKVVIVGADRIARELALKIRRHPEMLCEVVGFLWREDDAYLSPHSSNGVTVPALGVVDLLSAQEATDIIFALPKPALPEILNLAGSCRERGINVSFVPQPYELYLSRPFLLDLDGIPVLELRESSASDIFFRWKRLTDIVIGLALSIFALPIVLPAVLALRRTKGKVLRWEIRCGQHGKTFSMLRLNIDRHVLSGSRLERFLERMSITELPQLWNVLRGEMSLVGPRPESPDRVKLYSEWQQQRLSTKPGMTGLAQVYGLRDQNTSEEKTRLDLQYILNPSAVSDVSILLQTLWTMTVRLFQFRFTAARRTAPRSNPPEKLQAQFFEETLQGAHRSQSSAD